jgi:hypothetical protein
MLLHRSRAETEGGGDFAVRLAAPDEREDIAFALAQRFHPARGVYFVLYLEQIRPDELQNRHVAFGEVSAVAIQRDTSNGA